MTSPTLPAREKLSRPQPPTQEAGRWRYTDQYGRTFLMGYSDAANTYNRDDRDVLAAQHDALVAALDRLATEVRAIVFIESDAKMMELLADADAALRAVPW